MKNYWKQFAEWVTGSKHNLFQRARLKLTGLYIGIIAIILMIFSLFLYYSLAKNIRDNFEGNFSDDQTQESVIGKTTDQLQTTILFIDFAILLISSGLSYFLAGKTLKPIQQAMERQKQFTADASHELRTPLSVMQTNLEVALREKEWNKDKERALIAGAIDEVKLMTGLTEDLLTLSKLESKKKNYSFTKINITKIIEQVVKKMRNIAIERNVQLSIERSVTVFIHGDAEALQRLIMNIVSNAIHFTPAGGYVRATVEQNNGKAIVSIQDAGIGIPKEELPHVFERFYRVDKARGQNDRTGLGLAIAEEIARRHHGVINIESELGKGTTVTISFPALS